MTAPLVDENSPRPLDRDSREHRKFSHHNTVMIDGAEVTRRLDYDGANLVYLGVAPIGASEDDPYWQIQKFFYSGSNLLKNLWADGDAQLDNIWTERATLTYE